MIKNYYNGKNTFIDLVGGLNGTISGSPTPTITNGYISLLGGSGIAGSSNPQRVILNSSTYNYSVTDPFTVVVKFRTTKIDSNIHTIFSHSVDNEVTTGKINIYIDSDNTLHLLLRTTDGLNSYKELKTNLVVNDGKWHLVHLVYDFNNLNGYFDGKPITNIVHNDTFSIGNFYNGSDVTLIGAQNNVGGHNYINTFTGDIEYLGNYNHNLITKDIFNHYAFIKCCYS